MSKNTCDKCNTEDNTNDLIWIDSDDFKPFKNDNWDSTKHQNATEILSYSALCFNCYKEECCIKKEITIYFSERDLQELNNGKTFNWVYDGIDVKLLMGEEDEEINKNEN